MVGVVGAKTWSKKDRICQGEGPFFLLHLVIHIITSHDYLTFRSSNRSGIETRHKSNIFLFN